MRTPINLELAKLPPLVTFFNSNIHAEDSFPLSIGIFANGKSYAFHIRPQDNWKLDLYDAHAYQNTPLSFFFEHGEQPIAIKSVIERLIHFQKVIFVLNFNHDSNSLQQLGVADLIVKDIDEIDSFDSYVQRINCLDKTINDSQLNKYSVKDVIQTLAFQTLENLQYPDLSLLRYALFRYGADHLKQ